MDCRQYVVVLLLQGQFAAAVVVNITHPTPLRSLGMNFIFSQAMPTSFLLQAYSRSKSQQHVSVFQKHLVSFPKRVARFHQLQHAIMD